MPPRPPFVCISVVAAPLRLYETRQQQPREPVHAVLLLRLQSVS